MIDFFAAGFQFKINQDGDDKKKTSLGQLLSFVIILLSFTYLGYLIYELIERLVPPTISSELLLPDGDFKYDFDYSPLHVQLASRNHEDERIQNIDSYLQIWILDKTDKGEETYLMDNCSKLFPKDEKYHKNDYCLDPEKAHLLVNKDDHSKYKHVYVLIAKCEQELSKVECKTEEEIDKLLKDPEFLILWTNTFHELNHETGVLEDKFIDSVIYSDPDIIQHSVLSIRIAETDIDSHYVWPTSNITTYAYGYLESKYFYDHEFTEEKFTSEIFKHAVYINQMMLEPSLQSNVVIFEKISDMLAKFFSIFNTLLLIGFIGSMTSEAKLMECTMEVYLKNYYNKTALDYQNQQRQFQNFQKRKDESLKAQSYSVQQIQDLQKPSSKDLLNINAFKSLYLHQKFSGKDTKKEYSEEPDILNSDEIYQRLFKETQSAQEFGQLYREILQLKTQMQLVMSEQQYAASFYTNRRLCFSDSIESKNHLERQDQVLNNSNYRNQKLKEFIFENEKYQKKYQQQQNQQKLDKQLFESLSQEIVDQIQQQNERDEKELDQIIKVP